jgi:hypothetical protein
VSVEAIVAAVSAVVSVGTLVVSWRRSRTEAEAAEEGAEIDAAAMVSSASTQLLGPLRERVDELEEQSRRQRQEIESLWDWIDDLYRGALQLYHQVCDLGREPVYEPERPERPRRDDW